MKKITAVLLTVLMLIGVAPLTVFAGSGPSEETWVEGDYFAYLSLYNYSDENPQHYGIFKNNEVHNGLIEGASYDRASNTLTLTNFDHPELSLGANMMGDDFTMKIEGNCALRVIYIFGDGWGGSLRFTGTGTLTVNGDKDQEIALSMQAEYSDSALSFDKDVTVKLYGAELIGGIIATNYSDVSKAVVLANGQQMDVTGERNIYDVEDRVQIISFDDFGGEREIGFKLNYPQDPDALYTADYDEKAEKYSVSRYIYIERFDSMFRDPLYRSNPMTEEELAAAGFSFVMGPDKVRVRYLDTYSYEHRGYSAEQVINNNDPEGIYIANPIWNGYGPDKAEEYYVCRLIWSDEQDYYVKDPSFTPLNLPAEEFEARFTFATKEVEEQATFECWVDIELPPSDEAGNFLTESPLVKLDSDPDTTYIQIGTFGHNDDQGEYVAEGYLIQKPVYSEEYGVYFHDSTSNSMHVAYEDFETSGFSFVTETHNVNVKLYYVDSDYELTNDCIGGNKLVNSSEPDREYAAIYWGNGSDYIGYSISAIVWDEEKNVYFEDETVETEYLTFEEFEDSDYSFVLEEQPLLAYTHGYYSYYSMRKCIDAQGGTHLIDYSGTVYDYSEDDTVDIGGETCYVIGEPNRELTADDVTIVSHTVVTDTYNYRFNGTEFIYNGSGSPEPEYILGDVNSDQKVDVNDATEVQKIAAEIVKPTELQKKAADVNRDGRVDINDATLIQKFAAEIIDKF